jgi:hypothetical protein
MPDSKYSVAPGTKKPNPFMNMTKWISQNF